MSSAKNRMMELQERGYGEDDRAVCSCCVGNESLKQFIHDSGNQAKCDFCSKLNKCVSLESLVGEIIDGIETEYTEAVNEVGWDEGEYVGECTWNTYELLDDLNDDMELAENVLSAVKDIVKDSIWCENNPYALRENDEQISLWEQFCDMVKTETRYVFFRLPQNDRYGESSPYTVLNYISQKAEEIGLIVHVEANKRFYRGRAHKRNEFYNKAETLGSPPKMKAKANRMSAEGISVFYGASSIGTAIRELYSSAFPCASVAAFKNLEPLILLDLTKIDDFEYPSLFDKDNRRNRQSKLFFKKLCKDLMRPIEEMERIEYVPAQIVAEYFRYLYKYQGKSIDGIIYPSSKDKDGICYALFFDNEQCCKKSTAVDEQKLAMISGSAKIYNIYTDIRYEQLKSSKVR